jgi:hypothetical protein
VDGSYTILFHYYLASDLLYAGPASIVSQLSRTLMPYRNDTGLKAMLWLFWPIGISAATLSTK